MHATSACIATKRTPRPEDEATLAERIRRATGADAVRLEQRVQSLWGGYGELWRASLDEAGQSSSVVVKNVQPPPDDGSRSHRRKLRSYEVEQTFYAKYRDHCAGVCALPRARALRAERGAYLSVLQDLDALGFDQRRRRASASDVMQTLSWLAAFHAAFLGRAPEGLWKVGCYWHLSTRPDELAVMRHEPLRKAAGIIDARLSSARFMSFVHGDAKLENVCFARDGGVALVDFQYVGGGVGVKDVAYFLSSCLSPHDCPHSVPGYLNHYFAELRRALGSTRPADDLAQLEREWRALFPLAWVDLYRFLLGWAPGTYDPDPYSDALVAQVLAELRSR